MTCTEKCSGSDAEKIAAVERRARELFAEKRANCAEAVFRSVYEAVDSDLPPEVSSIITPLGGGVAVTGDTCGALLAGVSAMALIHGRSKPQEGSLEEHRRHLWRTYGLYQQLSVWFKERYGTTCCRQLTEPYIYGTKKCRDRCADITAETAGTVMSLLLDVEKNGLHFAVEQGLLTQAARACGKNLEELIDYKAKGIPFPVPEEGKS